MISDETFGGQRECDDGAMHQIDWYFENGTFVTESFAVYFYLATSKKFPIDARITCLSGVTTLG